MQTPVSLQITDDIVGTGRPAVPGDVCRLPLSMHETERRRSLQFGKNGPYTIRVGARDGFVGIEYALLGMKIGRQRTVVVPPNLTYHERKTYRDLPENSMLIYNLSLLSLGEKWDSEMERRLNRCSEKRGND